MWKDTNVSAYLSRRKEKKKLTKKMRKEDEVFTAVPECRFHNRVYSRKEY